MSVLRSVFSLSVLLKWNDETRWVNMTLWLFLHLTGLFIRKFATAASVTGGIPAALSTSGPRLPCSCSSGGFAAALLRVPRMGCCPGGCEGKHDPGVEWWVSHTCSLVTRMSSVFEQFWSQVGLFSLLSSLVVLCSRGPHPLGSNAWWSEVELM